MEIRQARREDKEQVLDFCRDTFSWGDYVADVWDKWSAAGGLYVTEEEGRPVGVYHVARFENESWLEGMRVHPAYRKKGLGTKMMQHAESVIRDGTVRLVIESENRPSIKLVTSVGYVLEEEWRLYLASPERKLTGAVIASSSSQVEGLVGPATYADSWRWLPLDGAELARLAEKGRIITYTEKGNAVAFGIWNTSSDFPQTFQLGYVGGTEAGVAEIIRFAKNRAHGLGCERMQVFAPESAGLESEMLEKRNLFYLMKKELGKTL